MHYHRSTKKAGQHKLIHAVLCLFFSLFVGSAIPQESSVGPSPYSRAIKTYETFVAEQMAFDQTPGISVGFIKDDFTWTRGFGYADLENRVPAKPESSYRMASITKTFTAFAILQLVEAGRMDLDAEIQTYVPYFPRKKWPITLRQLLGHLAGIPHYVDRDKELHSKTHKNTREAIAIFQDYDLVAEPGTKYHYSSYGYNLLGAAIEEVAGKSYGEYIQQHIFDPLGMSDSRMDDPTALIPNRVNGYRFVNGRITRSEFVDISSRFAAGGTRSTVVDLLMYARGIIQGKLLESRTWKQMLVPMATNNGLLTGRGMCWAVRPRRGHFQISHGGSQAETKTYLFIFPLENFAVAIASNMETFDRELYAYKLAELVLEEDLDTPVYVADEAEESVYSACEKVFSYGMSYYHWHSRTLARDEEDLKEAFAFFNQNTDPAPMRRNIRKTKNNLLVGIHPVAGQAFTKVGSFMAARLDKAHGRDKLRDYHWTGPIAFFRDYIALSQASASPKKSYQLARQLTQSLSRWNRDWEKNNANNIGLSSIPLDTEFAPLQDKLKTAFSQASLYPDFHQDLIRVAQNHLKNRDTHKALSFLQLATDLYPGRVTPMTALASLYLWEGNVQEAKRLFHKAYAKDPNHPGLSIGQFQILARDLIKTNKGKNLTDLAEIVTELYPDSSGIFKGLGDMFYSLEQKDTALYYYKKALKLDRNLKDIRDKIKTLTKERKK
jgi:CubicO group peptidase (beta-lactamase class C family)/tetratricopeptide (TPR) repeat protein